MIKILHAAETIKGGVATVIRTISNRVDDGEFKYEFLYLVPEDQKNELGTIEGNGVNTFRRTGRNLSSLAGFFVRLVKLIIREKPNVVHLHSTFAGVLGRLACFVIKPWVDVRVVYCPHAFSFLMESSPLKQKIYAALERLLQRITDVIICVSKFEMDKAESFGIDRVRMRLIYNGVYPKASSRDENLNSPIKLLFVGRLDYQKGIDVLVKAFHLANRNDMTLTVVGSSVHESSVDFPEVESIEYLSWLPADKVHEMYINSDVLVVPSRWEGFAMVPLEGMSMGLPVISSDCTSLPEVVADNVTGYTFPSGDHSALARVLSRLKKDEINRLGKYAKYLVSEKFNANIMIEQTLETYHIG